MRVSLCGQVVEKLFRRFHPTGYVATVPFEKFAFVCVGVQVVATFGTGFVNVLCDPVHFLLCSIVQELYARVDKFDRHVPS